MNVIIDVKISTEDGRVLFDEKRLVQSTTEPDVVDKRLVNVESIRLGFKWIEPYVD